MFIDVVLFGLVWSGKAPSTTQNGLEHSMLYLDKNIEKNLLQKHRWAFLIFLDTNMFSGSFLYTNFAFCLRHGRFMILMQAFNAKLYIG